MTNKIVGNDQQLAEQARQAQAQADANRNKVKDLERTIQNNTTQGNPTKATTAQLITGDY